jgi:hypothetical protein
MFFEVAYARQDVYATALNRTLNSLVSQMVQDDSVVYNKDAPFTVNNLEPRTLHMGSRVHYGV